jgi:SAM-dependent methyltransferase
MDVLDVGCGKGSIHPYLAAEFRSLVGVDVASALLETARSANPGVEYRSFDGIRLPFEASSFDLVFAICVLHHVPPAGWGSFVAEMHRVARKGGLVMLFEHNPWNPLTRYAVGRCEFDEDAVLVRAPRARALLEEAGLADVRAQFIIFAPVEGRLAAFLDRSLGLLPIGAQYFVYGRRILEEDETEGAGP